MSKDKRGRKCAGRHCAWCKPVRAVGKSRKLGVSADVYVPIVRTGKPVVTVVPIVRSGHIRAADAGWLTNGSGK